MTIRSYIAILFFTIISFTITANSGKDIYNRYCTVCHAASMATMFGSPAAHDLQAWKERKDLAFDRAAAENASLKDLSDKTEKEKHAIKSLVISATIGTDKGMPPMGTCMDCADEDLKATIEFMSNPEN